MDAAFSNFEIVINRKIDSSDKKNEGRLKELEIKVDKLESKVDKKI
jgi:hypothetical protein